MEKERIEVLDIFAGIGGLTQAFQNAGFTKVFGIESDSEKVKIYRQNFNNVCMNLNGFALDVEALPDAEILTGRLPACGYRMNKVGLKATENNGTEIYDAIYDMIRKKIPKAFLFEIKDKMDSYYQRFTYDLCNIGYQVEYKDIDAAQFGGISGNYLYIVGFWNCLPTKEIWPEPVKLPHEAWMECGGVEADYYKGMQKYKEELSYCNGAVYCWKDGKYQELDKILWNLFYPPLVCDAKGIRKVTHKEVQRIKGFDENYLISCEHKLKSYKYLVGASNVRLCSAIAENIKINMALQVESNIIGKMLQTEANVAWKTVQKISNAAEKRLPQAESMKITEKKVNKEKQNVKKCFVIMPFEKTLDGYYSKLIKPTLESVGYRVKRADEIYGTRPIIEDITSEIEGADILVADATGKNPNVNYELGYAHAKGKKVIIITQNVTDIPFDYRHRRAIIYNPLEIDWQEKLKNDLIKTVEAVENREHDK